MKLSKDEIGLLSEAMISLMISESRAGRNEKANQCIILNWNLVEYFLSQLSEEEKK